MKKYKKYIAGLSFFVIAVLLITIIDMNPLLVATQDVGAQAIYTITGIPRGSVAIQEIKVKKDWINGIGLLFTINGRLNTNDNVVLVLNSDYKVLYREIFSSKYVKDYQYYRLNFNKSIKVGKGQIIYLCHYSNNGEENNHVSVCCKSYSTLGNLYVSEISDNDVFRAVQNKTRSYMGSFIVKTYESNYNTSFILKLIFYLISAGLTLAIIYYRFVFIFIGRLHFKPELIFALVSGVFGAIFVFLTPPMQVPDEQIHFLRAYQVSELNILKSYQTLPKSIIQFDSLFRRMKFNSSEKTSPREILEAAKTKLDPGIRGTKGTVDYFLPYFPSSIGIFIGRIFILPPLILLYLGRIFNLFFSTFLIYLAIKITPVHKWVFLLLGLMPMTLFLLASLSYDAMVISLSFLLLSLLFRHIYNDKRIISSKDIAVFILITFSLAFCKAPYYMIGLLFLIIPVKKTGSWKKHLLVFGLIIISMFIATHLWSFCRSYLLPNTTVLSDQIFGLPKWMIPENPVNQIKFIESNITQFIVVLFKTTFVYRGPDYPKGFIGNLGWEDTPLPSFIILSYLIILFITAFGSSAIESSTGWKIKVILFVFFIIGYVMIETGFYIYLTPLKGISVEGVQGRYFIPLAPLFFILFYNRYINEKLNLAFSMRKDELLKLKVRERSGVIFGIQQDEQIFTKILNLAIVCLTVLSLLFTVYILTHRYYYIGESAASVEDRRNAENKALTKIKIMQENQQAETRYVDLANAAAKTNKLDSVTFYLEKVLDLDPAHAQIAHDLTLLYLQLKQKDKALKVIGKMKAHGLEIPLDLKNLAK